MQTYTRLVHIELFALDSQYPIPRQMIIVTITI
nr:MAG TPA: hypothetical protein [Caudoviricetes sp.]